MQTDPNSKIAPFVVSDPKEITTPEVNVNPNLDIGVLHQEGIAEQRRAEQIQQKGMQVTGDMRSRLMADPSMQTQEPPQLDPLPQYTPKEIFDPKESQKFIGMLAVFSLIGGAMTKQPAMSAMQNFAGGMKAYKEGRTELAKQHLEEFRANLDATTRANSERLNRYNAILNNKKLTLSQKSAQIDAIAANYQDAEAQHLLRSKNIFAFADHLSKMQGQGKKMDQQIQYWKLKSQMLDTGQVEMSPEALRTNAYILMVTGKYPTNLGRGTQGAKQRTQIDNEMNRLMAEDKIRPEDLPALRAQYSAESRSMLPLQNFINRVDWSQDLMHKNIEVLNQYIKEGVGGSIPAANKPIQFFRRQVGDANLASFDLALQTVAREYMRIMTGPASNAQMQVHAQQVAQQLLNPEMTPEQIAATLKVINQDTANAISVSQDIMRQRIEGVRNIRIQKPQAAPSPSKSGWGPLERVQ